MHDLKAEGPGTCGERAELRFDAMFGGLEYLHARFRTHAFGRHAHEEYVVALVVDGAEAFRCRGGAHVAARGWLYTINPGEAHDGEAATREGWSYLAIYPGAALIRRTLGLEEPSFRRLVWHDAEAARRLRRLHGRLRDSRCSLARESALVDALHCLVRRNGDRAAETIAVDDRRLRQVRDRIADDFAEKHSLESLGAVAELHPNYLLAAFRRRFGMTPAQFLYMRRLTEAKRLIRRGDPLKTVAQDTGFFDQAHFTRAFKRSFGVSPSAYGAARPGTQD